MPAAAPLITFLLLLSFLTRSPLLYVLDGLLLLVVCASAVWGRYCLAGVTYTRRFAQERLFFGEETEMWVEVTNAKPLPLAWLKAEDDMPADLAPRHVALTHGNTNERRTLSTMLTLNWYERVRRRYHLTAAHRGAFEFGPTLLSSGDLFGFRTRFQEITPVQTVLVYPKIVPLEKLPLVAAQPQGPTATRRRLITDPLFIAGARDYRPGDSLRQVHWKATARRGALQTKVFDPSVVRNVIICLNNQTMAHTHSIISDYLELAIVAAASVAQAVFEERHAVGLFTNGAAHATQYRVRLPAARHREQLTRILEALAQLTAFTILPFAHLLLLEGPRFPPGATVVVVSPIITLEIASALLALRQAGHPVTFISVGEPPAIDLPAGIDALHLAGDWRTIASIP